MFLGFFPFLALDLMKPFLYGLYLLSKPCWPELTWPHPWWPWLPASKPVQGSLLTTTIPADTQLTQLPSTVHHSIPYLLPRPPRFVGCHIYSVCLNTYWDNWFFRENQLEECASIEIHNLVFSRVPELCCSGFGIAPSSCVTSGKPFKPCISLYFLSFICFLIKYLLTMYHALCTKLGAGDPTRRKIEFLSSKNTQSNLGDKYVSG